MHRNRLATAVATSHEVPATPVHPLFPVPLEIARSPGAPTRKSFYARFFPLTRGSKLSEISHDLLNSRSFPDGVKSGARCGLFFPFGPLPRRQFAWIREHSRPVKVPLLFQIRSLPFEQDFHYTCPSFQRASCVISMRFPTIPEAFERLYWLSGISLVFRY